MKYLTFFIIMIATVFMVSCDEYKVGHGEHFGVFSWDKVDEGGGNTTKPVVDPEMCDVVVEQRCFEPSVCVLVRCKDDCGQDNNGEDEDNDNEDEDNDTVATTSWFWHGPKGGHWHSWKHWCFVDILSECDVDTIRCLLTSNNGWRIQGYVVPCDYDPCDPEWYFVEVGGFVIDIRNSLVLERVESQPCPIVR